MILDDVYDIEVEIEVFLDAGSLQSSIESGVRTEKRDAAISESFVESEGTPWQKYRAKTCYNFNVNKHDLPGTGFGGDHLPPQRQDYG